MAMPDLTQRPPPPAPPARPGNPVWQLVASPTAALAILAAFWVFLVAGTRTKSLTFDESGHAAGGVTYWRFNDYRFNPESGNLPQRVIGLPLGWRRDRIPALDSAAWRTAEKWDWAHQWFYRLGNDAEAMILAGRAASALFAVALAALVWLWARRLFGPPGGLVALLLCALNPTILANGALMTADTACALLFLTATWSLWAMLQRLTVGRVLLAGLTVGGLFVTKMSAALIVPLALVLVVARLFANRPLPVEIGSRHELTRRGDQALALAAAVGAQLIVVAVVIWGFYGFRYSAFSAALPGNSWQTDSWEFVLGKPGPGQALDQLPLDAPQREQAAQLLARAEEHPDRWTPATRAAVRAVRKTLLTPAQQRRLDAVLAAPPSALMPRIVDSLRRRQVLPEAYLYGTAYVWRYSSIRASFFNGQFALRGSPWFFPYTFLVKTPLALFGLMGLALAAARLGRAVFSYDTIPLWALLGLYWAAAILSHLNIGHRHILVTYPPLFILGGAAAAWLQAHRQFARGALGLLLAAYAIEAVCWFPDYLAYFNGLVRPSQAYRHLVDSSLDWGQDLPGVKRYLERHPPVGPAYFSYFGTASPAYYRLPAVTIYSYPDFDHLPFVKMLTVAAGVELRDVLGQNPDYDPEVVGQAKEGDNLRVLLVKRAAALRLTGGTFLISATMLQPVTNLRGAWGPWNERYEAAYQAASALVSPLLSDEPAMRRAAMTQLQPDQWLNALNDFDELRFARLAAYLRRREPDDQIGHSILVYRLTDADLDRALHGPPPELGSDLPTLLSARP
jgi:hypothetical protein